MMKFLSDEWIAAEQENKAIRDAAREAFWGAVGGQRVHDMHEIDVAPEARLGTILELLGKAGNKTGDDDILTIAGAAAALMNEIAPGALAFAGSIIPLRISEVSDYARKEFFVTDVVPTYQAVKIG